MSNNIIQPSTPFEKEVVVALNLMTRILQNHQGSLNDLEKWMYHLEGHIGQLSRRPAVVVKSKKALPFFAGAVAGVYIYRKVNQAKNDLAKRPIVDANYTMKPNGNDSHI